MNKHLLSLHDLTPDDIVRVLDTAESFREVGTRVIKKVPALRGRTCALAWKLPCIPLQLRAYGEHVGRVGEMAPITVRRWDRVMGIELGLRL